MYVQDVARLTLVRVDGIPLDYLVWDFDEQPNYYALINRSGNVWWVARKDFQPVKEF